MNPFIGLHYINKGFSLIRRPGIRRFVVIPLLVNILLFSAAIALGIHYFESAMAQIIPTGWQWLEWLLWPLFAITMLLVVFYSFTLIANFICAPFNSLLAEAVERELAGNVTGSQTTPMQALKQTPTILWNETRKIGYFLLRALPLLVLFFIPGINLFAPFIWFAFSAWLLSLEYLDYPMGNRNIQFSQQRHILKQHRISSLSFGASVLTLTMIPIINFIAMPLAVAAATVLYLDKIDTPQKQPLN